MEMSQEIQPDASLNSKKSKKHKKNKGSSRSDKPAKTGDDSHATKPKKRKKHQGKTVDPAPDPEGVHQTPAGSQITPSAPSLLDSIKKRIFGSNSNGTGPQSSQRDTGNASTLPFHPSLPARPVENDSQSPQQPSKKRRRKQSSEQQREPHQDQTGDQPPAKGQGSVETTNTNAGAGRTPRKRHKKNPVGLSASATTDSPATVLESSTPQNSAIIPFASYQKELQAAQNSGFSGNVPEEQTGTASQRAVVPVSPSPSHASTIGTPLQPSTRKGTAVRAQRPPHSMPQSIEGPPGRGRATSDSSDEDSESNDGPRGRGRPRKSDAQLAEEVSINPETGERLSHQEILSSRFLPTKQLKALERHIGLVYTKGPFKTFEDEKLKAFVDNYCAAARIDVDGFRALLFQDRALSKDTFWFDLTAQLEGRPVISVYAHVRRMFHPQARGGKWSAEEDEQLARLVTLYGRAWTSVGESMEHRSGEDCKDRWDNHVQYHAESAPASSQGRSKFSGPWTEEEEENLIEAVAAVERELGGEHEREGPMLWGRVAERIGTRTRHQSAQKWEDSVKRKLQHTGENGKVVKWRRKKDTLQLLRQIQAHNIEDEDQIPWQEIRAEIPAFEPFSATQLRKRWNRAKRQGLSSCSRENDEGLDLESLVNLALAAAKPKSKRSLPDSMRQEAEEIWAQKEAEYVKRRQQKRREQAQEYKSAETVADADDK